MIALRDVFAAAGFEVAFMSVKGGEVPLGVDRRALANAAFLDDRALVAALHASKKPTDVDPKSFDGIYFAGGHGTMWDLPNDRELASEAAAIYEQGGVVGAVCHGPSGLLPITLSSGEPLVKGKTVAAFTNDEEAAAGLTSVVPSPDALLVDSIGDRCFVSALFPGPSSPDC